MTDFVWGCGTALPGEPLPGEASGLGLVESASDFEADDAGACPDASGVFPAPLA